MTDSSNTESFDQNSTTTLNGSELTTPTVTWTNAGLDMVQTTVVNVTTSDNAVQLKVEELLAIVCSVFIAGGIIGGLSVYLMAVRKRRRLVVTEEGVETIGNPFIELASRDTLQNSGHSALRGLPSLGGRRRPAGQEEGYFVPDEGWAVINSNIEVEDVDIPFGELPGGHVDRNGVHTSTGTKRWSPQSSEESDPGIEPGTVFQQAFSHIQQENTDHDGHVGSVPWEVGMSFDGSLKESIPEEGPYTHTITERQHSSFEQSCSVPDGDGTLHGESLRHFTGHSDPTSAGSRRDRFHSTGSHRQLASSEERAAGGNRKSGNFGESQSDPGSPQDKSTIVEKKQPSKSVFYHHPHAPRVRLSVREKRQNMFKVQHVHSQDTAKSSTRSHTSAPPHLEPPKLAGSQLSLSDVSSPHQLSELNRTRASEGDRVRTWVESQENLTRSDFEVLPSQPGSDRTPSRSRDGIASESRSLASLEQAPSSRGLFSPFSATQSEEVEEGVATLPRKFGSTRHYQKAAGAKARPVPVLKSSSTGVLFPHLTQTLESHVNAVSNHPLASPTRKLAFTPPSQHFPDNEQTTSATAMLLDVRRPASSRASLTPAAASAEQRLSMHPVDVIEMDQRSITHGDSPQLDQLSFMLGDSPPLNMT